MLMYQKLSLKYCCYKISLKSNLFIYLLLCIVKSRQTREMKYKQKE